MLAPAMRHAVLGSFDAGAANPVIRIAVGTQVSTASGGGDEPRHPPSATSNAITVRRMRTSTSVDGGPLPTANEVARSAAACHEASRKAQDDAVNAN